MSTATQSQIAASLAISQSAVSCILAGKTKGFNEETVQRVRAAAKKLNYQADYNARGLVKQQSFLIGMLFSESESSWVIPQIMAGIQQVCDQQGYSIVFYSHRHAQDEEEHCRNCLNRRVEGLIVSGAETRNNSDQILTLQKRGIPIVEVFNHSIPSLPAVRTDMQAAGRQAAEYLLQLGHRRIAHFTHDRYLQNPDSRDMWLGFRQTLTNAGIQAQVRTSALTSERPLAEPYFLEALASAEAWLAEPNRPTAIWCYNAEHQAQALLWACRNLGVRVPQDVSVMGYNDVLFTSPALTTLVHPLKTIGRRAAEMIFDRLTRRSISEQQDIRLESELIERRSVTAMVS